MRLWFWVRESINLGGHADLRLMYIYHLYPCIERDWALPEVFTGGNCFLGAELLFGHGLTDLKLYD